MSQGSKREFLQNGSTTTPFHAGSTIHWFEVMKPDAMLKPAWQAGKAKRARTMSM
jgi:hypothetical protein